MVLNPGEPFDLNLSYNITARKYLLQVNQEELVEFRAHDAQTNKLSHAEISGHFHSIRLLGFGLPGTHF